MPPPLFGSSTLQVTWAVQLTLVTVALKGTYSRGPTVTKAGERATAGRSLKTTVTTAMALRLGSTTLVALSW